MGAENKRGVPNLSSALPQKISWCDQFFDPLWTAQHTPTFHTHCTHTDLHTPGPTLPRVPFDPYANSPPARSALQEPGPGERREQEARGGAYPRPARVAPPRELARTTPNPGPPAATLYRRRSLNRVTPKTAIVIPATSRASPAPSTAPPAVRTSESREMPTSRPPVSAPA